MSREIKFRVWYGPSDLDCPGLMKYGHIDVISYSIPAVYMGDNIPASMAATPDYPPDEFMQYTGLKDKNGKEIYEGDILQWRGRKRARMYSVPTVVAYKPAAFWAIGKNGLQVDILTDWSATFLHEVIGNIHENPELLE
jgi:hypothetical protein